MSDFLGYSTSSDHDQFSAPLNLPSRKRVKLEQPTTYGSNSGFVEAVQNTIQILRSNQAEDLPGLSKSDYVALRDACTHKIEALKRRRTPGIPRYASRGMFGGETVRIPAVSSLTNDVIDQTETKKNLFFAGIVTQYFGPSLRRRKNSSLLIIAAAELADFSIQSAAKESTVGVNLTTNLLV
jgi:hypothetical protein